MQRLDRTATKLHNLNLYDSDLEAESSLLLNTSIPHYYSSGAYIFLIIQRKGSYLSHQTL